MSISAATNEKLTVPASPEEIKEVIFPIHPDKAPGPYGFSASFFQSNWEVVRPAMIKEIQHFLPHDPFPIVSIIPISDSFPKFRSLKSFLIIDLLPSVIFITMSYLKSSLRLKPVLEGVISENQSAFIPGRLISDNVLIMHEVLHFLKSSGAVKHCSMAVKTYISKAYDRLEWTFI